MERLFKHIVVPLDFTRKNSSALRVAYNLAKQSRSRVTLLHVIETIGYAEDEEIKAFYASLRDRARAKLTESAERFKDGNVPVAERVLMGKTAPRIVTYAHRHKADLVVLSSHKVELDERPKGWATLSYQVSILCPCPVMLVK